MASYGFDVVIEAADILGIPSNWAIGEALRLSYDILITDPGGNENAWFEGEMRVRDGVTRPLSQDDRDAIYQASYEFREAQAA